MERSKSIEYKDSMSDCLKGKRVAIREVQKQIVRYQCKNKWQKLEIYMGEKNIKSLILE